MSHRNAKGGHCERPPSRNLPAAAGLSVDPLVQRRQSRGVMMRPTVGQPETKNFSFVKPKYLSILIFECQLNANHIFGAILPFLLQDITEGLCERAFGGGTVAEAEPKCRKYLASQPMTSSGSAKLLNFLRENESSLLSLRPRKPGSAQPLATGWNANRGKLLREAVEGIRGQERSISLEQRWGKVLCKVLLSASDEVRDASRLFSPFSPLTLQCRDPLASMKEMDVLRMRVERGNHAALPNAACCS
jgi:hypothetical protein